MKPLPALLLLAACSRELAPRPMSVTGSLADRPMTASFAMKLPDEGGSHTTTWADTNKLGETTFYSRGRVVTTVAVLTDSLWAVRPPVLLGLPDGPFNLPPDSLCTLGYTGTTLPVVGSTVLQRLERTRQCRARTFAVIRRAKLMDPSGRLSVQATEAELKSWPWPGLCNRVEDSTIIAFYIGDDVTADEWGPAPLVTRLAQWDTIAGLIQARCPGAPVAIRATPTQLEARAQWQWLTTAWAQYTGPRRHGTPEQFLGAQVASAKRQRLGLVAGVNLLNGGCGPAARCAPRRSRQYPAGHPAGPLSGERGGVYLLQDGGDDRPLCLCVGGLVLGSQLPERLPREARDPECGEGIGCHRQEASAEQLRPEVVRATNGKRQKSGLEECHEASTPSPRHNRLQYPAVAVLSGPDPRRRGGGRRASPPRPWA